MMRFTKSEMGQHVGTALAQAIARAIGARVRDLPITPERVNQALKRGVESILGRHGLLGLSTKVRRHASGEVFQVEAVSDEEKNAEWSGQEPGYGIQASAAGAQAPTALQGYIS
jgi:hypothetical protein